MAEPRHKTVFDTGQQYIGSTYAKALVAIGQGSGNTEQLLEELESLNSDVLASLPKLAATLASPRVAAEAKERILDLALEGKMSKELLRFLKVVARRGRFDCLPAIADSARQQFNQSQGRVEVLVRSADVLDDQAVAEVTARLKERLGRDIELQLSVDPELIAGLVVRVGDTVYDGSLSNRLLRMRDDMVGSTRQRIGEEMSRFATTE